MDIVRFIILRRLIRRRKENKKRKLWVHPINLRRHTFGSFNHLFPDLLNDSLKFYNFFRMSVDSFFNLNTMLRDEIMKQNTNYRRAVQTEERLAIFLR